MKTVIGKRVDVLSARIIDELEYLIRYYISSESSSVIHEMNYHDDTGDDMEMEVINDNDNDLEEEMMMTDHIEGQDRIKVMLIYTQ